MRPRCSEADESVLGRFEGSPAKCLSPGGEWRETLPASLHPRCRGRLERQPGHISHRLHWHQTS